MEQVPLADDAVTQPTPAQSTAATGQEEEKKVEKTRPETEGSEQETVAGQGTEEVGTAKNAPELRVAPASQTPPAPPAASTPPAVPYYRLVFDDSAADSLSPEDQTPTLGSAAAQPPASASAAPSQPPVGAAAAMQAPSSAAQPPPPSSSPTLPDVTPSPHNLPNAAASPPVVSPSPPPATVPSPATVPPPETALSPATVPPPETALSPATVPPPETALSPATVSTPANSSPPPESPTVVQQLQQKLEITEMTVAKLKAENALLKSEVENLRDVIEELLQEQSKSEASVRGVDEAAHGSSWWPKSTKKGWWHSFQQMMGMSAHSGSQRSPSASFHRASLQNEDSGVPGLTSVACSVPSEGNTCYLSAVLLCLYNLHDFSVYFIHNHYINDLRDTPALGTSSEEVATSVQVAGALAGVFTALHQNYLTPAFINDFRARLAQYDPQFDSDEQQEAHDFLSALLSCLHDGLTTVEDPAGQLQSSHVSRTFAGVQESRIHCSACHSLLNQTREAFMSLSLSVSAHGPRALQELLERWGGSQAIEWDCAGCGGVRPSNFTTRLLDAPSILIIHLSRNSRESLLGNKTFVAYPEDDLKITYHPADSPPKVRTYRLCGVCQHSGGASGGHYTAACRSLDPPMWHLYTEEGPRRLGPHHQPSPSAHLLFYRAMKEADVTPLQRNNDNVV